MTYRNFSHVLKQAIRAQILDLHVALPASVEKYDPSTQKADIKPLLKKKYSAEDSASDHPVIPGVPVQWPAAGSGKSYLHLPIKPGDLGLAVFCDRSLDAWLAGDGGSVDVRDPRHHHLSDAVFIPGMQPFAAALADVDPDAAVLQNDRMRIELHPDGRISMTGPGAELVTVMASALETIAGSIERMSAAKVNITSGSSSGLWPLDAATVVGLTTDKTALDNDIADMETLKV